MTNAPSVTSNSLQSPFGWTGIPEPSVPSFGNHPSKQRRRNSMTNAPQPSSVVVPFSTIDLSDQFPMAQSIEIKPRKRRPVNKSISKMTDPILAAVAALERDTSNDDEIAKFLAATSQGTGKTTTTTTSITGKDETATQQQSRSAAKYEALNDSWLCLSVDGDDDDDDDDDDHYPRIKDVPLKDKTSSGCTRATATTSFVSKAANAKAKEYVPPRVPIGNLERSKSGRSLRANAA